MGEKCEIWSRFIDPVAVETRRPRFETQQHYLKSNTNSEDPIIGMSSLNLMVQFGPLNSQNQRLIGRDRENELVKFVESSITHAAIRLATIVLKFGMHYGPRGLVRTENNWRPQVAMHR